MSAVPAEVMRIIVLGGYLVIVALAVVTELRARRRPDGIAPLGDMLAEAMTSRIARIGIFAAWWWFGWHFLAAATVQLVI